MPAFFNLLSNVWSTLRLPPQSNAVEAVTFALMCLFVVFEGMDLIALANKSGDDDPAPVKTDPTSDGVKFELLTRAVAPHRDCLPDECACSGSAQAALVHSHRHIVIPTWQSLLGGFYSIEWIETLDNYLTRLLKWAFLGSCIYHFVTWRVDSMVRARIVR